MPVIVSPRAESDETDILNYLARATELSVVAPYILLYRHVRGAVHILRIVHGRQRITGAMLRQTS